jgi:hypothetical protein
MAHFDFDGLEAAIEAASRQAVEEVAAKHPDETFSAFALYTDAGAMTVCPALCTKAFVERKMIEEPDEWLHCKYLPSEWPYESVGADAAFNAICDVVREHVFAIGGDPAAFVDFKQRLIASCISVQMRLRRDFFAGRGDDFLLMVTISDDNEPVQVLRERVGALNGPALAEEYRVLSKTWD